MDPAFAAECLEALERYGVLVFPALGLTDEEQIVFSGRLGDVIPMGGKRADGSRDPIFKVSLDPKHNEAAEYLKGTIYWHIDGATEDIPARATMLSARRISAVGGQTEFCNTYAAYDDLPESERPYYESLRIGHSLEAANRLTTPDPSDKELAVWRARGGVKGASAGLAPQDGTQIARIGRDRRIRRGPVRRGQPRASRQARGSCHTSRDRVSARMAGGRSGDLGQLRNHAPGHSV
jgi:hypothetical protein